MYHLEQILPSIIGAKIISTHKTRLGGYISHILMADNKEAYVKVGIGFERLDVNRQYKNICSLQGHLTIPQIYDYVATDNQAAIVLEKMPGLPLHNITSSIGRQAVLLIIKDILSTIYDLAPSVIQSLNIGVYQELEDIKYSIDNKKINENAFETYGVSPKQAYNKIKNDLQTHDTKIFSHGDLCLPNIMVTSDKKWSLIDLGKCGAGDIHRDLSSLKVSLTKNIDQLAFFELCEMMNIKLTTQFENRMHIYKMIDLFWYNTI